MRELAVTEAAWNLREKQKEAGSLDSDLRSKLATRMIKCSKNHLNGPTAKVCWKCGEDLKLPKTWNAEKGWHTRPLPYETPGGTKTDGQ